MFSSTVIYNLVVLFLESTNEKPTEEGYAAQTCIIDDCLCMFYIIYRWRFKNTV